MWLEIDFTKMTRRDAGTYRIRIELIDDEHETSYKKSIYYMMIEIDYHFSVKLKLPNNTVVDNGPDLFKFEKGPDTIFLMGELEYAYYKRRLLIKPLNYIDKRSSVYQKDYGSFLDDYRATVSETRRKIKEQRWDPDPVNITIWIEKVTRDNEVHLKFSHLLIPPQFDQPVESSSARLLLEIKNLDIKEIFEFAFMLNGNEEPERFRYIV